MNSSNKASSTIVASAGASIIAVAELEKSKKGKDSTQQRMHNTETEGDE